MRVLIDASPLLLRSAGVKSYFYHWLESLWRLAPDDVRAFPFIGRNLGPLDHERSILPSWQTWPRLIAVHLAKQGLMIDAFTRGADVFHVSNLVRTPPRRALVSGTVHDMSCWLMPQFHTAANVQADRGFAGRVLKKAAGLIAVSESTRRDVIELLGVNPDRVRTIYSGVPQEFFDAEPAHVQERPYALFVGTIEPRKNLDALLDAWRGCRARADFDLLVAGPDGWRSEATVARLEAGGDGARYLGYVPQPELPGLTSGARVLLYPSLYEGFGFPPAQAMAAGVPVITSNVSALPEVVGDGGILVDPRSVDDIRAAIERLLYSDTLRAQLSRKARARAELFRWERAARQSLEFFSSLTG